VSAKSVAAAKARARRIALRVLGEFSFAPDSEIAFVDGSTLVPAECLKLLKSTLRSIGGQPVSAPVVVDITRDLPAGAGGHAFYQGAHRIEVSYWTTLEEARVLFAHEAVHARLAAVDPEHRGDEDEIEATARDLAVIFPGVVQVP
jgi:hypothetical protein